MAADLAHALGHMADFFQGLTRFSGRDQDDFGLETAGDFGVQAWGERMAGIGVQSFGDQHVGAIGRTQAQADNLFQQLRFLASRQLLVGLDDRQRGWGLDRADRTGEVERIFDIRFLLRHGFGETDAKSLPL